MLHYIEVLSDVKQNEVTVDGLAFVDVECLNERRRPVTVRRQVGQHRVEEVVQLEQEVKYGTNLRRQDSDVLKKLCS